MLRTYALCFFTSGLLACSDAPFSQDSADAEFDEVGVRANTQSLGSVIVTEGSSRPRRRHENDQDFSKYNPFYWEGRQSSFKVEDFTPTGEKRIKFTLTTEWPQDYIPTRGPDFSAIYIGNPSASSETERSKFALNIRMTHVRDARVFEATLGPGEFAAFANQMQPGQILTFEFRFFLSESFSGWAAQKAKNPHNISAYYSEFLRIRIGQGGLFIDDPLNPNAVPATQRYAGGWTTTPTTRVEPWRALQQQANNILPSNSQRFMTGRTWFHTDFVSGEHATDEADDKPTIFFDADRVSRSNHASSAYNVRSCSACHINNGTSLLPGTNTPVHHTVARTFDTRTGSPHGVFGKQLQTQGAHSEGTLTVASYETRVERLADGTEVVLKKPRFAVNSSLSQSYLGLSPRRPQAMIGLGLLAAVPEATLKQFAQQNGGTYRTIDGKMGRFGWKADQATLSHQIQAALNNDLGVLSSRFPSNDCGGRCTAGKGQLSAQAIADMEAYLSLLGVPPRMYPTSASGTKGPEVVKGEAVFDRLGCQRCHVKSMVTGTAPFPELSQQTIQPFTDLLLHDMGTGLSDGSPDGFGQKWRTPALWGLKNVKHATDSHVRDFPPGNINLLWQNAHAAADQNRIQFLHDGRAESLAEAILWHGGEAQTAVNLYKGLSLADRKALEAYLWDL
ncbi:di-heme oxidoredictase family protein [Stigmatella hybrida]|uniref:di-heme oxidoredictase family protein n=1 Tax=Stigmatella hybrida TaxID=394097 RepID=UPI001CDAD6D9|nr:di-heme oxidoredictase family protein [Stigmatella hybrida]